MPYLPQIKILVPSAQVSSYTTGVLSLPSAKGAFVPPSVRGIFNGGNTGTNVIDYITVETTGNAIDFGDLIHNHEHGASVASATRAVIGGGTTNGIEYLTILTLGNGTDFGDLTAARGTNAGHSSSTRGLFAGGDI
jgi:hypothetical protein